MLTAAEQLKTEVAALPYHTSAAADLLTRPERFVSGELIGAPSIILGVLFPGQNPPGQWWRTALGLFCAADRVGGWRERRIPHSGAAEILGVKVGTIGTLANRGDLPSGPDGIQLGDVLDRLVRLNAKRENNAQDSTIAEMSKNDSNPATTVEEWAEEFVRVNGDGTEDVAWAERIAARIRNDWDGNPDTLTDLACEVA